MFKYLYLAYFLNYVNYLCIFEVLKWLLVLKNDKHFLVIPIKFSCLVDTISSIKTIIQMKSHFPLSNNVFYVFFTLLVGMMLVGQLKAQNINNYVFSTNQTSSLNTDLNANPIDMTVGTTQLIGSSIRVNGNQGNLI
jgi:hypothetical protein